MNIIKFLIRSSGTAVVIAAMAGLGYYGHSTGWKAPKFADLLGNDRGPPSEEWCEAHKVPRAGCVSCNPALLGGDPKDWCREHGVPESKCAFCHPEVLQGGKAGDWCSEHGLPESQCTICDPGIAARSGAPPDPGAPTVTLDPAAKAEGNPSSCITHLLRVQFASAESMGKAGIRLEEVAERPLAVSIQANGEVEYDQARLARIVSRVPGTARRIEKSPGDRVKAGDVLLIVDSQEVGRSKIELLHALGSAGVREAALARLQASAASGFRTQGELEEARAALREARVRLLGAREALANLGIEAPLDEISRLPEAELVERVRSLGLPPALLESLGPEASRSNLLPILAPLDGIVISRDVVVGEAVDPTKILFTLADTRRMWVTAEVPLEDAALVEAGQAVTFRPQGSPDLWASGKVSWISTAADEKTRTVKVRAEVENPGGKLRAHAFGTARIEVRKESKAICVSAEAVQWEGCCPVVFVKVRDLLFQARKVRLGARSGPFTEILAGALPGEVVASAGSHVLKSEILRSKLGVGCAGE